MSARLAVAASVVLALLSSASTADARFEPGLNRVSSDKGEIFSFGCLTGVGKVHSPSCHFGDLTSQKNLVILGDSHAMQWGPGLIKLAERKNWQVTALTRASCSAALVKQDPGCDLWRRNSLERISRMKKGLVVVASAANYDAYTISPGGYELDRESSQPLLVDGMVKTLRRLRAGSWRTVLIRDQSVAPFNVTRCLRGNRRTPGRCGFQPDQSSSYSYDYVAARQVAGVAIIDPRRLLCPRDWCHPVIRNKLVYRNQEHLSATFARSTEGWLGRSLGDPWE